MASKGALVVRFIGDMRDLNKTTVRVSKSLSGLAPVAAAAGVAAGAALAAGVVGAMNVEKANDKLAGQLGLSAKKSKQVGKVAGRLYSDAYGDSMSHVNDAVGAVMTSIDGMGKASGKRLEAVTAKALDFATAFEVDVTRASQVAGQVVRTGLAKNATQAFDLLTAASQKVPAALREDVLDGIDEYGQFFAGIGMSGEQAFSTLVEGAKKGQFGIDKIGDAVKEFTIRSTDMSTSSKDAYEAIGLNAGKMANKMVKGGKTAGKATQEIVKGLLSMKPGAKQANAAIALFGTPLEDLSVQEIPAFLKQLQGAEGGLGKVAGASARLGKTLNDNAATNLESFKRQVVTTFVEFVGGKALPAVNKVASALATGFGPALKTVTKFLERNKDIVIPIVITLGTMVGIIGTVVGAMKAWAAAQAALNVVMALNPIGLVIIAVAALAAGLVWFFTKTKLGQKIIKGAWSGIKSAIKGVSDWWTKTAWPAIKGAIKAMGDWFQMVGRVATRAWKGLGRAMGSTWRWIKTNVINPFIFGLKVWGEIFKLVGTKVRGAWDAVGRALVSGWRWIKRNVFDRFVRGLGVMRDSFLLTRDKVAGFFGGMRDRLARVAGWITGRVFGGIRSALSTMRRAFGAAKDGIGRIWEGLKKAAARPIRFLIDTVWNNGLRKMINAIPGVPYISPTPAKFATGGAVRGGIPGKDSVRAWLMPNEHVWTAREVAAAGGHKQMLAMRKAVLSGNLNGDPRFAKGGALSSDDISRASKFALSQRGKPYGWGAVGPSAYDCSGFMSAITNVLRGYTPYDRVGSTANFPWGGFQKGPGQFTVVSTPNFGYSGVGHMAGTLGGMNVESRGGRGVIVGPGAMGAASRGFSQMYHLGAAGPAGSGGIDWLGVIKRIGNTIDRLPDQITEMMAKGGWIVGLLKKMTKVLWNDLAGHINKLIPDLGPIAKNPIPNLARGGIVKARPGGTVVRMAEGGYDEAAVPMGGPHAPRGGSRPRVVYVDLGDEIMKMIRSKVKDGGGNVQLVLGRGR